MKKVLFIFVLLVSASCNRYDRQTIILQASNIAAAYTETFMTDGFHAQGLVPVRELGDNTFEVSGISTGHGDNGLPVVSEGWHITVHWKGGDIHDIKNWELSELFIGDKRVS